MVRLRFDPTDRRVVVHAPGTRPKERGPELKRCHCAAFDKATILGDSKVAWHPVAARGQPPDTLPVRTDGRRYGT